MYNLATSAWTHLHLRSGSRYANATFQPGDSRVGRRWIVTGVVWLSELYRGPDLRPPRIPRKRKASGHHAHYGVGLAADPNRFAEDILPSSKASRHAASLNTTVFSSPAWAKRWSLRSSKPRPICGFYAENRKEVCAYSKMVDLVR